MQLWLDKICLLRAFSSALGEGSISSLGPVAGWRSVFMSNSRTLQTIHPYMEKGISTLCQPHVLYKLGQSRWSHRLPAFPLGGLRCVFSVGEDTRAAKGYTSPSDMVTEAQTYCYRPALQVSKINLFIQYLPQGWYKFLCLEGKHIYLFVSRSMVCPQLMLFNRWVGEWRKHLLRQGAVFSAGTSVWYPRKALTLRVHVYGFQQAAWVCFSWNPVLTMPLLVLGRLWWFYLLAKCLA